MFLGLQRHERPKMTIIDYTGAWQSDPELKGYIRKALLWPPNWEQYNLEDIEREDFSEYGQSIILAEILHNMEGGFFIEAKAGDGEHDSISLYLERNLEWSGLLVEDDLVNYLNLTMKSRQSYSICASLSTTKTVTLKNAWSDVTKEVEPFEVSWELPLYSLILAMGPSHINLLILNTLGTELEILQTIPWDDVTIDVLCIAYTHLRGTPRVVTEYLRRQNFTLVETHIEDLFFASNKFLGIQPPTRIPKFLRY